MGIGNGLWVRVGQLRIDIDAFGGGEFGYRGSTGPVWLPYRAETLILIRRNPTD